METSASFKVTLHCVAWSADRQCIFCLHRTVKGIGHESCAFSRGYPRPCHTMQNVKHPDKLCRDPYMVSLTSLCYAATLAAHHRASHSSSSSWRFTAYQLLHLATSSSMFHHPSYQLPTVPQSNNCSIIMPRPISWHISFSSPLLFSVASTLRSGYYSLVRRGSTV